MFHSKRSGNLSIESEQSKWVSKMLLLVHSFVNFALLVIYYQKLIFCTSCSRSIPSNFVILELLVIGFTLCTNVCMEYVIKFDNCIQKF